MMRSITLLACFLLGFAASAQIYYYLPAQNGNPGGLNQDDEYPVGGGLDASWTSILTGSKTTPVWTSSQTVPFTFKFNNVTESSFKVSSTGVLTFTTSATSVPGTTPAQIPSSSIPDKSIMVWGISGEGSSDQIAVKTFGTAPNRQHWIFFTSYTMPGNASSWTYWSIVLEETTNNIYIVDQRNSGQTLSTTAGIQVNSTTAYSVAGSPNVGCLSGADPTPADNKYYQFLPGPQPQRDAAGVKVNMPNFLTLANAPFTVEADFINLGTSTITSADINYKINGGATVTAAVSGLNIATFQTASVSSPTAWNPTAGTYTVEVWLSNLNGSSDQNTSNDMTSKSVNVVANATTRYPLYETFTSSTCPPCTPANQTMEALFANNPGESVSIKYQMSWPGAGDPYFTAEGNARRTYYAVSSVPNVAIDGGWNNNGNSLTQAIFDQYQGIPSFANLTASYSISGQKVCVDVTIDPVADVNVSDLVLHVAIKENKTTQNIKTNGETEFFNVMKKMVPNENGTSIPALVQGQKQMFSFCYTFNGSFRLPNNASDPINHATEHSVEEFSDLGAVAWIQSVGSKQVYQATEAYYTVGIDDFDAETHNLMVYPNPAKDYTTLSIDMAKGADANIEVINALGQTVLNVSETVESGTNKVRINTASLNAGVYFVRVNIDGVAQTVKLTVQ